MNKAKQHETMTPPEIDFDVEISRLEAMTPPEIDFDIEISRLEFEWRQGYEASIAARAAYQTLAVNRKANAKLLDAARERLDRAEVLKSRIMAKIEKLEAHILSRR